MSYGCWIGCCSNFKWWTLRSITSSRGSIPVGNEYDSAIPFLDFSSGCILSIINNKKIILYLLLRKNYGKFWIIPPFFLLMLLYQARKLSDHVFMCFWESILPLSTIFLLDFGNVVLFVFILMEKKTTYTKRRFGPVRKPRGNQYMLLLVKALKVQCYQILYMYM